ncbi:MAG: adenylate/guanylate cyclase domain-containing protein [Cyanobacteriota bacterium]|nr:adenylate/guanylate cyclase domain-containing protein [Cyanobacteriota bacterium]
MILVISRLTIKSKLTIMLLGVSLGSILVIGYLSWNRARNTLQETIFNQLTSVRSSKAYQIESYFQNLRNHVETLSENRMIVAAMVEFNKEFKQLNRAYIPVDWVTKIEGYYENEFFPRLSKNIPGQPNIENYRPLGQAARYLQYYYVANNPNPLGEKDNLVKAEDGSEYSNYHAKYHQLFRNLIKKFGYYDLFLINFETGDIVYSVYKETDYATNLQRGPYRQSNLAKVIQKVRENPDRGSIQLVDFQPYRPSYAAPAAFFAAPIYNGPYIVGILAVQLPVDEINNVLTGNQNWEGDGLGESGETYLVGSDFLMRSISRFLIEDMEEYTKTLRAIATPESTVELIQQLQTSILLQLVDTEAAREALQGIKGTKIVDDYRGIPVLSSYSPLNIEGVDWAILSEMDVAEAYRPMYGLQTYLLRATVILILLITFLAWLLAYKFVEPINTIMEKVRKVGDGELDVEVKLNSKDEFGELAHTFNEMVRGIRQQTKLIEEKNRENEELLLNILPTAVAERMKKGEDSIADRIEEVTVLFASLGGLSKFGASREVREIANMLNELIHSFDVLAEKHYVEKLKTISERYIGVCGVATPRLDHAKQSLDLALEMLHTLERFNSKYGTDLTLRIGIDSGEVMAGIIGIKKFMYDLWGETVNIASYLSLEAKSNTILVSEEIYNSLHDLYVFQPGEAMEFEDKGLLKTWMLIDRCKL